VGQDESARPVHCSFMTDAPSLSKEQAEKVAALRELSEDVLVANENHPFNWQSSTRVNCNVVCWSQTAI
jgi:hypothetical protein